MACYHPMRAVVLGIKANGKKDIKIIGDNRALHDDEIFKRKYGPNTEVIDIPCGKCIGCRLDYAKNWANRCVLEAKRSPFNFFITLTYDNEYDIITGESHLPFNIVYDFEKNRKLAEVPTLKKEDLQKFFKNLRYYYSLNYCLIDTKFKYYACGEYGELNGRPHYHICLFNCQYFDDRVLKYVDSQGFRHYSSKKLDNLWKKGLTEICDFSWQTASYTARYVMKKHKGLDASYYEDAHMCPEFTLMSRRPGIAYEYYIDNKNNIYKYDKLLIEQGDYIQEAKPSRYFDKLFDLENHDGFIQIQNNRQNKMRSSKKFINSSLTPYEYLDAQEENKKKSIKSLIRKEI